MSANNTGPDHYKAKPMQPWDFIVANNLGYLEGNVIKYVSRWRQKGGVEDLHKAKHYIEKLIETALDAPQSANPGPASIGPGTTADATLRAQSGPWYALVKQQR